VRWDGALRNRLRYGNPIDELSFSEAILRDLRLGLGRSREAESQCHFPLAFGDVAKMDLEDGSGNVGSKDIARKKRRPCPHSDANRGTGFILDVSDRIMAPVMDFVSILVPHDGASCQHTGFPVYTKPQARHP
jgi:hypothetical protein